MTCEDPKQRYTVEQALDHPYMKGNICERSLFDEIAFPSEVRDHYYSVIPVKEPLNIAHYNSMQEARSKWGEELFVLRSKKEIDFLNNNKIFKWSG